MKNIADLIFEARILKALPRSGYNFLGCGKESVAEHSFMITFIAYAMSKIVPEADANRLISMCIVHDLPEARIGDLNYVQKKYVTPHEDKAVTDIAASLPFGEDIIDLIHEFNSGKTLEAKLANDADQLALIIDLKALSDIGYNTPSKWLTSVLKRLKTDTGIAIANAIMDTEQDSWWLNKIILMKS